MLAKRIIPTVLCRGRQLVKGRAFNAWRTVGMAAQAVKIHQARGVDEIILLDISATSEQRGPDLAMVRDLTEKCFSPITVGGGIRTIDHVHALMAAGADKVAICTAAFETNIITQTAARYGTQAVVAAVDTKDGYVYSDRGTRRWPMAPAPYAVMMEGEGAGEILLTSMELEASMGGYDLPAIRDVSEAVGIPVIAHGGCGGYHHMHQAIEAGASAVAAGALFQFTECTPKAAADYLAEQGVEVRR